MNRKHFIIILLILLTNSFSIFSQTNLSSGRLVFKQIRGGKTYPNDTIWYSPNIIRDMYSYHDLKLQKSFKIFGKDTVVYLSKNRKKEVTDEYKKIQVTVNLKDTASFAGIKCQKAIMKTLDKDSNSFVWTVYYNPKVGSKKHNYYRVFKDIDGIPLYVSVDDSIYELIEFTEIKIKDIDIPRFVINPKSKKKE